ncbi:MAG: hypothetical protein ACOC8N_04485 [Spirochaetota bacterium]
MRAVAMALWVLRLAAATAGGEEQAFDYERYRREARELFIVEIEEVKHLRVEDGENEYEYVYARARVLEVVRTRVGVSPGEYVYIRYIHRYIRPPGSILPAVEEGAVYTAYLNRILAEDPEAGKLFSGWDHRRQFFPCVEEWSFVERPGR